MPSDAKPTIVSDRLTVSYGPVTALRDFSVEVPSGIVGLLGHNGAGKSTFIKSVLGLITPSSGSIRIFGRDSLAEGLAVRDMVGYMPEHDCLMDTFTAVELVSYLAQVSGLRKSDAIPRSHEMLDFVGIGEERYRPISSYSTGMKQRVKLAQAIVHDPKILFLDEPTNGMDPQGREDILGLIGKIRESDKTILVSTHILDDIEKVSDHAIIVGEGRLIKQGNLEDLLRGSQNLKVVKVRGPKEAVNSLVKNLGSQFEVRSATEEGGQWRILLSNPGDGSPIFKLCDEAGVQLRAYFPDRLSLEDFFIDTVKGGAKDGH